jgi:hypothetical protein
MHSQAPSELLPVALFHTPSVGSGSGALPGAVGVVSPEEVGIDLAAGAGAAHAPADVSRAQDQVTQGSHAGTPAPAGKGAAPPVQPPGSAAIQALKHRFLALQAKQ